MCGPAARAPRRGSGGERRGGRAPPGGACGGGPVLAGGPTRGGLGGGGGGSRAGSGGGEYRGRGTRGGDRWRGGLREGGGLDPPLFTPATKAETGHDENITVDRLREALGAEAAERLRTASLALYGAARDRAAGRGIIIADTKFEFGHDADGKLLLIDELLTPDSSRFWPADRYQPGKGQPSFDKQPLRDYLSGLKRAGQWNGNAPGPHLPAEVVQATSVRYQDAYLRITGEALKVAL